jgi:probable rRNA maturation factor
VIDVQVELSATEGRGSERAPQEAARLVEVARTAVEATLADRGVEQAEVSVTLLDDEAIRALNREYLGHDRPTDVLSFALYGAGEPVLGDVYVGWEQAAVQADREDVTLLEEMARLVVHGTLHVLGHDHPDEAEARARSDMYRVQESILAGLDLPSTPAGSGGVA